MRNTSKSMFVAAALALSGLAGVGVGVGSVAVRAEDNFINEVKIGGLYHDVPDLWSGFRQEPRSLDVNIEALLGPHVDVLWGTLRPAIGATINTRGATSKAYMDARWQIESASGIFFGIGLGGAVHDGTLAPTDPNRKALGYRYLFHIPGELGYRWDGHNSISIYFEHISNAYTQNYNEGLDAMGVRYGYRF